MRDRPTPKALLSAYKACLDKADVQARALLAEATAAELEKSIWVFEEFVLPRGARLEFSVRVTVSLPSSPPSSRPELLRIEGPKR